MSLDPNKSSRSSKSTSSSKSETKAQAHPAPEPSSSAETMTDQPSNATLATPPTRMTSNDEAASKPNASAAATPQSSEEPSSVPSASSSQPAAESVAEPSSSTEVPPADRFESQSSSRNQPIPPASEPMQYRAIGLVRGKYTPSAEQFTRGFILTDDEVLIDAVLLGRVMSLVKKHINLEESHLWVVYPRTREKDMELHMQIVGVWEPEKLNRADHADLDADDLEDAEDAEALDADEDDEVEAIELEDADTDEAEIADTEESAAISMTREQVVPTSDLDDRYFSVRGEVVYQSDEEERILVKIRRAPKPGTTQSKAFKVALKGVLKGKALGYFWDLQVQRDHKDLVIKESTQIGMVPPQKRTAGGGKFTPRGKGGPRRSSSGGGQFGGPPRKRWQEREGTRPQRGSSDQPASAPRQPISKPVKRREKEQDA